MSSQVFLCNLALANVAKPFIQSIDAADPEAVACKQFYGHVLNVLLSTYPWRFARKTQVLEEVTNTKPGRWQYAYARPTDCLKVLMVTDDAMAEFIPGSGDGLIVAGGYAYDIEGGTIFCNVSPAYLVYTAAVSDPSQFPPLFEEAFGWQLAVRLAMPLTRDPKVRADAYQLAMKTTDLAAAMDANEVRETSDHASEVIEERS